MKSYKQIILILSILLFGCSDTIKMIYKTNTQYGKLKFFSENLSKNIDSVDRIYASVDSSGYRIYYSFYKNAIVKRMETDKQTYYTAFFGELPKNYDAHVYIKFTTLDSLVLNRGDILIDSLNYKTLKKSKGSEAYIAEVVYYHGWPNNKKFRP